MSQAKQDLTVRVARLATGPGFQDWKAFLDAFKAYVAEGKDDLVRSSADQFLVSQGLARERGALLKLFEEAVRSTTKPK